MIGIVADDVTGSNDIGLMFAKHLYKVEVFSEYKDLDLRKVEADVIILDTNSRCDRPEIAYAKVADATRRLQELGPELLMNKTCSVFRGNIGSEFDAMLDTTGADFAVIVVAFPKNGRLTKDGLHYVHGKLLAESEFANDPVNPMKQSDLLEIIREQSRRPVQLLGQAVVDAGLRAIRSAMEKARRQGGYLVCDVSCQDDLTLLAEAFANEPLIFGSSAIGEELPAFRHKPKFGLSLSELPHVPQGVLLVAGSVTSQTKEQVAHAKAAGIMARGLDTRKLFTDQEREVEVYEAVNWAVGHINAGDPCLIHSLHQPDEIKQTKDLARATGMSAQEGSQLVSATLGEVTRQIVAKTGTKKLVVLGGETSNDVCRSLGIVGNLVIDEIQPGLPSGLSRGKQEMLVILKSGSFGSVDFISHAIKHLEVLSGSDSN